MRIQSTNLDMVNERGDRLVKFAENNNLFIMNTFFQKKPIRKWTWTQWNEEWQ